MLLAVLVVVEVVSSFGKHIHVILDAYVQTDAQP
jgi:hypothetical protein